MNRISFTPFDETFHDFEDINIQSHSERLGERRQVERRTTFWAA